MIITLKIFSRTRPQSSSMCTCITPSDVILVRGGDTCALGLTDREWLENHPIIAHNFEIIFFGKILSNLVKFCQIWPIFKNFEILTPPLTSSKLFSWFFFFFLTPFWYFDVGKIEVQNEQPIRRLHFDNLTIQSESSILVMDQWEGQIGGHTCALGFLIINGSPEEEERVVGTGPTLSYFVLRPGFGAPNEFSPVTFSLFAESNFCWVWIEYT